MTAPGASPSNTPNATRQAGARHVVLFGLMASGKSTIGRLLAERLGRAFLDNDAVLQERTGQTAREIAATDGVDGLHHREAEALVASRQSPVPAVIGAAAAAPFEPLAGAALRDQSTGRFPGVLAVYLHVRPEVLVARLQREPDDGHRPFTAADAPAVLAAQYAARDPGYRALAALVVEAGDSTPDAVVDEISAALAG